MAKWAPLGLLICLACTSLLVKGAYASGYTRPVAQKSIQGTQGVTPTYITVTLNTTEIFAFSSGKVTLNITSDGDGTLRVNITSAEGAITPVSDAIVPFTASQQLYEVPFNAALATLPGTFVLQVSAWYVNVSNGNNLDPVLSGVVNVRLGIGLMLGVPLLLAIVTIAIVIAIKLRKPAATEKTGEETTKSSGESSAAVSGVANKIRCPECKKLIDEGSVFCAECGARIPEFLRYNVPQT